MTSAMTDPYGYVYTKVNNDSKHPLVLNSEQRIENARVLLYWQDTKTNEWVKWPAQNYYQENPLFTNKQGEYSFMVPEGNYYLTVYRDGYQFYRSEQFTVKNNDPHLSNVFISANILSLQPLTNFNNTIGVAFGVSDNIVMGIWLLLIILSIGLLVGPFIKTAHKRR